MSSEPVVSETKPSFWSLAAGEPFRIFFPVGVLFGLSGVSLWPLFFSGIHRSFYPGTMHARMMIEGFLGAFVLGFLGTAAPRLTGTSPFSRKETFSLLALFVVAIGVHIAEQYKWGDVLFLLTLLTFVTLLGKRFGSRDDLPPPSFTLVAFGFLNAVIGVIALIIGGFNPLAYRATLFGSLLLYQGFVLYLILGIGGFLLPRMLGIPRKETPESRLFTPEWKRPALAAALCGFLLLISFALEVFGWSPRPVHAFRFVVAATFLLWQLPFYRAGGRATLMMVLKLSLVLLLLGLAFPIFAPLQRVAGLHVLFVGGFTLLTFAVATRVVLGHSGNQARFTGPLRPLAGAAVLLVLAAVLRAAGDFMPMQRGVILSWASYLWMAAACVWAVKIVPLVRQPDSE